MAIFNEKMKANENVKFFGCGDQKRDWVFVEDIVSAMIKTLDVKTKFSIIGLGSGIENSVNELFTLLKNKLSYNLDPIICSPRSADIKKMVMDNKKARHILKWSP